MSSSRIIRAGSKVPTGNGRKALSRRRRRHDDDDMRTRRIAPSIGIALLVACACVIALGQSRSSAETFQWKGPDLVSTATRPLFGGRPLAPGQSRSRCVLVTADGPARDVRLFARTRGSGLDPFLQLTIVRGSLPGPMTPGSCSGFRAIKTLFSGSLGSLGDSYASGAGDPDRAWPTGETRAYRVTARLAGSPLVQGLVSRVRFVWEAPNP
jgi:hypothetical protein